MRFKRAISSLLALLMLATQLPITAFAAEGDVPSVIDGAVGTMGFVGAPQGRTTTEAKVSTQVSKPADPDNTEIYPGIGNPGYVQMTKSAQWTDVEKTRATVTFDLFGQGVPTGVDTLVITDLSNSMYIVDTTPCKGVFHVITYNGVKGWYCTGGCGVSYDSQAAISQAVTDGKLVQDGGLYRHIEVGGIMTWGTEAGQTTLTCPKNPSHVYIGDAAIKKAYTDGEVGYVGGQMVHIFPSKASIYTVPCTGRFVGTSNGFYRSYKCGNEKCSYSSPPKEIDDAAYQKMIADGILNSEGEHVGGWAEGDDGKRAKSAAAAVELLIDTALGDGLDVTGAHTKNRVALISFGSKAILDADFTEYGQRDALKTVIQSGKDEGGGVSRLPYWSANATQNMGGTNYTAALTKAAELIEGRTDQTRPVYIIFLTDGVPVAEDAGGAAIKPAYDNSDIGNPTVNGVAQIREIEAFLANEGVDFHLHTISFNMRDPAVKDFLKDDLSGVTGDPKTNHYFNTETGEELLAQFQEVAGTINEAGVHAILTDTIGEDFTFDSSRRIQVGTDLGSMRDATVVAGPITGTEDITKDKLGTVNLTEQVVTWGVPKILTESLYLQIPVKLKEESKSKTQVFTNAGEAELTYISNHARTTENDPARDATQTVRSPLLGRTVATIETVYYLVNADGNALGTGGSILETPSAFAKGHTAIESATKVCPTVGDYPVEAVSAFAKDGQKYELVKGANYATFTGKSGTVTITEQDSTKTVYFGYKRASTSDKITVKFDKNDGTEDESARVTSVNIQNDTSMGAKWPADPIRTDYIFGGWYKTKGADGALTDEYKSDTTITLTTAPKEITLYAKWTRADSQVTVSFEYSGGPTVGPAPSPPSAQTLNKGSQAQLPGELNLPAGWMLENWHIKNQDGSISSTPYDFSAPVNENITLVGNLIKDRQQAYKVTYDANGGTGGVEDTNQYLIEDPVTVLSGDGLAKPPSVFQEWNTLPDGGGTGYQPGDTFPIAGDTTLYAIWGNIPPAGQATVTFNVGYPQDSGSPIHAKVSVAKDSPLGDEKWPGDPNREGYIFAGWYLTDANLGITDTPFTKDSTVGGDMTVMAKWTRAPGMVEVTFAYSGGPAAGPPPPPPSQAIAKGGQVAVPGTETIPPGWMIENWYPKNPDGSIGSVPYDFTTPVEADMTLVGVLTKDRQWAYTVTYDGNGGTGSVVDGNRYLIEDRVSVLPADGLTNGEKIFLGWNTQPDGSGDAHQPGDTFLIGGDTTLYAIWGDPGTAPIQILHKYYVNRAGAPEQVSETTEIRDAIPGQIFGTETLRNDLGRYRYWKTQVEVVPIPKSRTAAGGVLTTAQREAEIARLQATVLEGERRYTAVVQRILAAEPDLSKTQVEEMIATVRRLRGVYGSSTAAWARENILALEQELMELDGAFEPTISAKPPAPAGGGNGSAVPDSPIPPPDPVPESPVSPDISGDGLPTPPENDVSSGSTESQETTTVEDPPQEPAVVEQVKFLSGPAETPPSGGDDQQLTTTPMSLATDYGRQSGKVLDSGYKEPEPGGVPGSPDQGGGTPPEALTALLEEYEKAVAIHRTLTELERLEAIVGPAVEDTLELAEAREALAALQTAEITSPPAMGGTGKVESGAAPLREGEFLFEEGYVYLVTISYSRTVNTGGGEDPDPEPDPPAVTPTTPTPTPPLTPPGPPGGGGNGGGGNDTILIPEGAIPLTENPELFTIFGEDIPLGNLPQTGGTAALAMGRMGGCALLLGAALLLYKRKED